MDTIRLIKVLNRLAININKSGVVGKINELLSNVKQFNPNIHLNANERNQITTQINALRENILQLFFTIMPYPVSIEDGKILESLDVYNLFGQENQKFLAEILNNISTSPNEKEAGLIRLIDKINSIGRLYEVLSPFSEKILADAGEVEKDLIILYFQGGEEITNLGDFPDAISKWNTVFRSFALLAKENDTNFKIEKVERGSLIVFVSTVAAIVIPFGKTIIKILDTIKIGLDIKKVLCSLRPIPGVPEKVIKELEETSKINIANETEKISKEIFDENGWKPEDQRGDVHAGINYAVRHMLGFINNGGKIDINLIAENDSQKIEMNLSLKYSEIKKIENEINLDGENQPLLDSKIE